MSCLNGPDRAGLWRCLFQALLEAPIHAVRIPVSGQGAGQLRTLKLYLRNDGLRNRLLARLFSQFKNALVNGRPLEVRAFCLLEGAVDVTVADIEPIAQPADG